jgi:hypothetical protein
MIHDAATLSRSSSVQTGRKPLRWEPKTTAQIRALNSSAEILLFGGAAGSLKTETLLIDAVREAHNPNLNAIIFRESYPQLADIIRKSRRLFTDRPFWGKYNAGEHIWTFPRNLADMREAARRNDERYLKGEALLRIPEPLYDRSATLKLGYLRNDDDCADHDGQEYSFIGFDESTHHTEYQIRYLLSRLRSTDPTLFCRMRLATNPGNVGHAFHMKVFIGDECPHCKPKSDRIRKPFTVYRDARFSDGTPVNHSTEFIPGRVTDHSLFADPTNLEAGNEPYIRKLELQKPALAKALKEGCWAQFQGQYFTCWDESRGQEVPEDYHGPDVRMIIPFAEAPVEWWYPHFTGTDWGVGSSQAASYLCVRTPADEWFPNGRVYVLKEFCRPDSDIDEYPAEFLKRFVVPELDGERRKIVASYLGPDSCFFVLGLLLIPIGIWLRRRRLRASGNLPVTFPAIDPHLPVVRRTFEYIALATMLNLLIIGTASYRGVQYMDSTNFCGTTCHTVMEPNIPPIRIPRTRMWLVSNAISGLEHRGLCDQSFQACGRFSR